MTNEDDETGASGIHYDVDEIKGSVHVLKDLGWRIVQLQPLGEVGVYGALDPVEAYEIVEEL